MKRAPVLAAGCETSTRGKRHAVLSGREYVRTNPESWEGSRELSLLVEMPKTERAENDGPKDKRLYACLEAVRKKKKNGKSISLAISRTSRPQPQAGNREKEVKIIERLCTSGSGGKGKRKKPKCAVRGSTKKIDGLEYLTQKGGEG